MNWDQWKHLIDVFAWIQVISTPLWGVLVSIVIKKMKEGDLKEVISKLRVASQFSSLIQIPKWSLSLAWLIAM